MLRLCQHTFAHTSTHNGTYTLLIPPSFYGVTNFFLFIQDFFLVEQKQEKNITLLFFTHKFFHFLLRSLSLSSGSKRGLWKVRNDFLGGSVRLLNIKSTKQINTLTGASLQVTTNMESSKSSRDFDAQLANFSSLLLRRRKFLSSFHSISNWININIYLSL